MFAQHARTNILGSTVLILALVSSVAQIGTGPASASTNPTFLAASNTEPAFDFLAQDFIQNSNGGQSVTFSFGGSGHLAGEIDGGVDFSSDGTGNAPAGFALFASADEANVDNTIPYGASAGENPRAVQKYGVGRCVDPHSSTYTAANGGNNDGTSCPGIGSTRAQYTTGRLVIFSCRAGGATLAPAEGSPTCAQPVSGFFTKSGRNEAPSTMTEVWRDLLAHTNRPTGDRRARIRVATSPSPTPRTVGYSQTPPAVRRRSRPTPRTGSREWRRSTSRQCEYYHAHPRRSFGATTSDQACREIDNMTDKGVSLDNFNTTSSSSGGQSGNGNYSDPSLPIIFGDNVTYTQDSVVAGTSQIALLPKSFVISPAGDDSDFWAEVPECGVANAARATVSNGWTTHIADEESCTDRNYVAGMRDNVAAKISSRNFGTTGAKQPPSLVGQHGYYQPIRQWVVVENDDQGQSANADLASADGVSALAFIHYLLSAKGQAVLASFGYDPIS